MAISEYIASFDYVVDAYILETKEINSVLVASFKKSVETGIHGIAVFTKGLNQKYRIIQAQVSTSNYTSIVQVYPLKIKKKLYYVVSGHNFADEIKYYGLDYYGFRNSGYLAEDEVKESIIFDVKKQQFLELYHEDEVESMLDGSVKDKLSHLSLSTTPPSFNDANGEEVTEQFNMGAKGQATSGIATAELFIIYVYIAIVFGLGFLFTRYFLTK